MTAFHGYITWVYTKKNFLERDNNDCNKSEDIEVGTEMQVTQTEDVVENDSAVVEAVENGEAKEN